MYDVIILGAGLSGATLATLLCNDGYNVVLLDKGDNPNFHLPETVLSDTLNLLFDSGVSLAELDELINYDMKATFVSCDNSQELSITHTFLQKNDTSSLCTLNRSKLDSLLLSKALSAGVIYKPGAEVKLVDFSNEEAPSVIYQELGECKRLTGRLIIDASGKSAILANCLKLKKNIRRIDNRKLIFSHFENELIYKKLTASTITIAPIENGHVFMIPLRNNRFSVGVVLYEISNNSLKNLEEEFNHSITHVLHIADMLKKSDRKLPYIMGVNEAFECTSYGGKGFLIIGEAAGFIDPLYSNGISFNLKMVNNAHLTVRKILSCDEGFLDSIKAYNSDVENLFFNDLNSLSDWISNYSITLNQSNLCDPHIPFGITYFLSSHVQHNDEKNILGFIKQMPRSSHHAVY